MRRWPWHCYPDVALDPRKAPTAAATVAGDDRGRCLLTRCTHLGLVAAVGENTVASLATTELNFQISRAALVSAGVYTTAAAMMGRHLLASPATTIAGDVGDPVLNAAILAWNARVIPWTDAWFNFPGFHPATNALTFSEHLLGVSVIASPLHWITGDAIVAYNLTLLLGYVLSGLAMFALVSRLTGSALSAFVAGAAFAFAPYRAAQLPHIQVGIVFWAPLSLLGLHRYLDTGRRRWLALFGACWALQGAANGYFLVFFSVLVGLWIIWFVVMPRRWRDLWTIAATLALAVLPLLPILARFASAHAHYGLSRPPEEVAGFGADIAAVFCASRHLALWDWLQVACRPEGDLFPGLTLVLLCAFGAVAVRSHNSRAVAREQRRRGPWLTLIIVGALLLLGSAIMSIWSPQPWNMSSSSVGKPLLRGVMLLVLGVLWWTMLPRVVRRTSVSARWMTAIRRAVGYPLFTAAVMFIAAAISVAVLGPWQAAVEPFDLSSIVSIPAIAAILVGMALWLQRGESAGEVPSVPGFYIFAALATWIISWGPAPVVNGTPILAQGPYAWLMLMPGMDSLRVPARFWMMTVLCLSVLAGFAAHALLRRRSRTVGATFAAVVVAGFLADGWATVPAARVLPPPPDAEVLRDGVVLTLPLGSNRDIDINAQLMAVTGGWKSVNGFSGYEPFHYGQLRRASSDEDPHLFAAFVRRGDLHVVTAPNAGRLVDLVERQPGVVHVGGADGWRQYRIPRRGAHSPAAVTGSPLPIRAVSASCSAEMLPLLTDGDWTTRWHCGPQTAGQALTVDLGAVTTVAAVVPALGDFRTDQPRRLAVELSIDGLEWREVRNGDVRIEMLEAEIEAPLRNRVVVPFAPGQARYVRLRQTANDDVFYWSIAELEVWSGTLIR